MKRIGLVVVIGFASFLLMGQASPKRTVEANEFLLRDTAGVIRARLALDNLGSARLVLLDKDGKEKTQLSSGWVFGGQMTLEDEEGKHRVFLSADSKMGGTLSLLNDNGSPGTILHTASGTLPTVDAATISMISPEGKRLILTPGMVIIDRVRERQLGQGLFSAKIHEHIEGAAVASLGEDGLSVSDDQGFGVTVGATELTTGYGETRKRSAASIVLVDKGKNVIWKVP